MKSNQKIILILLAILCLSFAKKVEAYGAAGCGLGSVVITENKVVHQVIAATVNGLFSGNQLFGITTGTLNCKTDGVTQKEKEREIFVHLNYDSLMLESAQGKGEKLEAFASLMECKDTKALVDLTKKNHSSLFANADPSDFLVKIKLEMSKDTILSKSCKI
ncbi:DUF3015 family protein [Leptospira yasudae]|uniref:DUF3015 family protein n=1 Tax=Leptospira yasudae TaxID=2202201 RepID=UPI001090E54C|nr:DUF3015 family protein [Leptospira yasudae]MBW0435523.1 DUF3015 family protein [Leptospira yasudae]TGN01846.1 DUF3015 domain-containing protein [Leptospira yasudae]